MGEAYEDASDRWAVLKLLFQHLGGMTAGDFQEALSVSRDTLRKWQTGRHRIPESALLSAHLFAGNLGKVNPDWQGWRLDRETGGLIDPEGTRHTTGSIQAWHWTRQQLQDLRGRENQIAGIGGNVVPGPGMKAEEITQLLYQKLEMKK